MDGERKRSYDGARSPDRPNSALSVAGRDGCGLQAGEWRSNLYEMTRAMMDGVVRSYSSITQRRTRCARHSQTRHLYAYAYATAAAAAAAAACNDDDVSRVAVASITRLRSCMSHHHHDLCVHVQPRSSEWRVWGRPEWAIIIIIIIIIKAI